MSASEPRAHEAAAARVLLTPEAVRERAHELFDVGVAGGLAHWAIALDRLGACADLVVEVTRANYPTLNIPFHARWRHFSAGGRDRWGALEPRLPRDPAARARAAFDLAIVSVLLDAGAGMAWRHVEPGTGAIFSKSEGLALASLDLFASGALSADPADPLRADAEALARLAPDRLAHAFQVRPDNPLVGLDGRLALLRRLGVAALARPDIFAQGDRARPGGLFDRIAAQAKGGRVPARAVLIAVLEALGPIWPGREKLGDIDLGDCWRHPAIKRDDATNGLIPFHKLSQWLAYSLIEPIEAAGLAVTEIDALTGLAEYRNGGLFVDAGVIALRDPREAHVPHAPASLLVVEWRALTVALLDRLAPLVRARLGLSAAAFPLAKMLEGGTWWAGRKLAREARADGGPPLAVASDGTLF